MGYHRAGFDVVGVDINPQPHYPFEFHQADALEYPLNGFDAYHASPPCQKYSIAVYCRVDHKERRDDHPDLIQHTRQLLNKLDKPFVIENVKGSPLTDYIKLHGTMFCLTTNKERWFELHGFNIFMLPVRWASTKGLVAAGIFAGIMQHSIYPGELCRKADLAAAYKIDWPMSRYELRQAIPPAYTEFIGRELIKVIQG